MPVENATATPAPPTVGNQAVIEAIRTHHGELAEQLATRTDAVLAAARDGGDYAAARDRLHGWYRSELMPHIEAEEQALYNRASELDVTRLLVSGMLDEHRALIAHVAEFALGNTPMQVVIAAAAARAVFEVHLHKENDLLLPALTAAGVDLGSVLDGMHEILGHGEPAESEVDGCGCGCGCSHDEAAQPPATATDQVGQPEALDVRTLPHGERHEIIFGGLDQLDPGESLVIVNDHDPKPLRYQTQALWPDRFEWSYLQAGPRQWRVAITRVG